MRLSVSVLETLRLNGDWVNIAAFALSPPAKLTETDSFSPSVSASLTDLDLSHMLLEFLDPQCLNAFLGPIKNLRSLRLSGCPSASACTQVLTSLPLEHLQMLVFQPWPNRISDEALNAFKQHFLLKKHLVLHLEGPGYGDY